jgi:general secretion pathway protein G
MKGFTLIELLVVLVIASILALFGGPLVMGGIDCKNQKMGWITRAKVNGAIGDLGSVYLDVRRRTEFTQGPIDFGALDLGNDRWGNPYQFLDHSTVNGHGKKRKGPGQVPINSRYDLYSMGPDGRTRTPIVSEPGSDDIIIANDGQYIGVACFYDVR